MKVREGFVSNSSSSSFILYVPKDDMPKVIEKMKERDAFLAFVVQKMIESDDGEYVESARFLGKDLYGIQYASGSEAYPDYRQFQEWAFEFDPDEEGDFDEVDVDTMHDVLVDAAKETLGEDGYLLTEADC